jgi:hypothetical protein
MSGITLGKVGYGKLWECVEMSSMIAAGSYLALAYLHTPSVDVNQAIAFSTVSFFAGKGAYGIARGLLQRVALFSTGTDRILGWAAAILTAAYAGKKFIGNKNESPDYQTTLGIVLAGGVAGVVAREAIMFGIKNLVEFKKH